MNKKKTLIFTATYNENENISKLISLIKFYNPNVHILIIDDNSPDKTSETIFRIKKKHKNIKLIVRKKKLGLDTAHKEAFNWANRKKFDYLITMDADLSHDPKEIKNFKKKLKEYDFVIGSRYTKGGKCLMTGFRYWISFAGNKFIKFILNSKLSEFTTSYRGFNLKKLKKFKLDLVKNSGYSFFMGTVFEIENRNFKIKEIPIIFYQRSKGKSKISKIEIFRAIINLFLNFFKKWF